VARNDESGEPGLCHLAADVGAEALVGDGSGEVSVVRVAENPAME